MKNSTIRLIVILASISIVGITITQIYWVKRAFDLKESEFNNTVRTALSNVAHQIFDINNTASPAANPVNQVSTNYFIVLVNSELSAGLLEFLLRTEFEKRNITADFEYGIYDCSTRCMIYGDYVSLLTASDKGSAKTFPNWATEGYHFGVRFPTREAHLMSQMGIWVFSSIVLLIVIVFFSYTLFVIMKQKRLSEIQKDFINNMTHEFKTPISTIAVSTQVLRDPAILQQPARLASYTTIIENENNRLKQHVERVLQMAKLDKGSIGLKKEEINLHNIIEEAAASLQLALRERGGSIQFDFNAENACVQGDQHHITNVIYNLLDNALKYCNTIPAILVKTSVVDKAIKVEVQDNGIGIRAEHQKKIFEKFYRVPTGDVHDVKGFGLGLHYVKMIIEQHKGHLRLESKAGHGCSIQFTLPQ